MELQIKKDILAEIMDKYGMFIIDPAMFGPDLAEMMSTDPCKMSLGIRIILPALIKALFNGPPLK